MALPQSLVRIVMSWHHNANYHINHDGVDRVIKATQGVRQGCAVAPLLWLIFSHLVSEQLAEKIGYQATVDLLNIFADDYHCSAVFHSVWEVEQAQSRINVLLCTLRDMGMLVSPNKSQAILKCAGPGAEALRRRFIRKVNDRSVLRIRSASGCIDIPLVESFIYLGAVVSYDHFEDRTLAYRMEVGAGNFGRLSRVLRGRHALTRSHKLRIWQACVYTATVYSLDACGLTPQGAKRLTHQLMRQIRLIIRDPVYMTGKPHQTVLEEWGLLTPLAALRRQLNNEAPVDTLHPDAFKRGPDSPAWQRVMSTLVDPPDSSLTEVPDFAGTGVPCPECGVYFADRTSMLCHMSKRHKHHESRPVNQPARPFDKHSDAKGGLPQCRHCNTKLYDFSSLRKHINDKRCKVLFPIHPHQPPLLHYTAVSVDNDKPPNTPTNPADYPSHRSRPYCSNHPDAPTPWSPPNPQLARSLLSSQTTDDPGPAAVYAQPALSLGQQPPPDEEQLPYFQRPRVQQLLAQYSSNAAFHLKDRQWLRQHCALCSQWIACHTKVKQHYRLSHPTDFDMFAEDAKRACCQFNTPASPCEHCGSTVKAYTQHPSTADRSSHGTTAGDVRTAGRGAAGGDGLGTSQEGSRGRNGNCQQSQSAANGTGQGRPWPAGSLQQTTLAQSWGQGAPCRRPPSDPDDQGPCQAGAPTGDRTQDSPPGLQLGPVCPTGEPRTTPNALCGSPKVEESPGGEHNNHYTQNSTVWLLDSDASCGTQGHRERGTCPFPEKSGGDEMAEGWPLELSKVVPCTREPGGGRSPGPSATHQAYRGDHGSAAVAHAAPHDTSVSCHQAPHGEHDRHCDLPAGYLQPHLRTPASMGMPRGIDRPHGSAGHRAPASEGHAQTVTGCRASPTSIGRLLLIRLLNSSNTCYMNASIRAWLFAVSHMQVADILKYGQHEQVLQGRWESRIVSVEDGTESRGSHVTQRAITLDLPNPDGPTNLQALINHWHNGDTYLQACTHLPRILVLRLCRFKAGLAGATIKLHTRVDIPMQVQVPAFMHRTLGADCTHHSYTVVACILHNGATADAGHYIVRYLNHMHPNDAPDAPHQWIADDSKPTQSLRIQPNNDVVLGQQCYLALLCRTNT